MLVERVQQITALFVGNRISTRDLLKNPAELARTQIGEFDGAKTRGGTLKNLVYKVRVPGPDDRPMDLIIVGVAVLQPNDTVKYKYMDLGPMAQAAANV